MACDTKCDTGIHERLVESVVSELIQVSDEPDSCYIPCRMLYMVEGEPQREKYR